VTHGFSPPHEPQVCDALSIACEVDEDGAILDAQVGGTAPDQLLLTSGTAPDPDRS